MATSEDNPHLTLRPDLPPDLPPDLSTDLGPDLELGRHYVKGQQVNVTEDLRHEFKGHRSISVFDLPSRWSRDAQARTRSAVSASVGGMMNTGVGGTVYLGVSDEGRVVGLPLTGHQQQHITASLAWTLDRFTPPVGEHRYHTLFVPVLSRHCRATHTAGRQVSPSSAAMGREREGVGRGAAPPHRVATPNRCWCDEEAARQASPLHEWVVEIHLRPWDPHTQEGTATPHRDCTPPPVPPLPPLHLTEANVCYYRHGSRQVTLCLDTARRLLVHRTDRHYTPQLASLRAHLHTLHRLAVDRGLLVKAGEARGEKGLRGELREGVAGGKGIIGGRESDSCVRNERMGLID
ncbi:uncharacterized protein LOC135113400 [Scylla paramamosain]|uniref:uncharacterized protein LOC135113400 n=1 Tax=Scylla paramamosain TaxID=85552 RepID=UPI003082E8C5